MSVVVKVTNNSLYGRKVEGVDVTNLVAEGEGIFIGAIYIYTSRDNIIPFYGLVHGGVFEEEYGFILKNLLYEP